MDSFAGAEEVRIGAIDTVSAGGMMAEPEQTDLYQFTAAADGYVRVDMQADGSDVDSCLEIYNAWGRRYGFNDNAAADTLDSSVLMRVRAGETYFVRAMNKNLNAGAYRLNVTGRPNDDVGNTVETAATLRMNAAWGSGAARGTINYAGDEDVFAITAASDGLMTVDMTTWGRWSSLSGELTLMDADGNVLAYDGDDADAGAAVSFRATAGQTYYAKFGSLNGERGAYGVKVTTVAEPFASAQDVALDVIGDVVLTDAIAQAGQAFAYRFTAQADGEIHFTMTATSGNLDPVLTLYRDPRRAWYTNDNAAAGSLDAHLGLRVRRGDTYYIVASGNGATSGEFALTISPAPRDDHGNTAETATGVYLNLAGAGAARGTVDYAGDVDVLSITAPVTGTMTILQDPWGRWDNLSTELTVMDAQGQIVAQDANAANRGASVTFDVAAGQTYTVHCSALDGTTGIYGVRFATVAAPAPEPDPDPTPDPTPAPTPDDFLPGNVVSAMIVPDGTGVRLVVTGTEGNDTITVSQSGQTLTLTSGAGSTTYTGAFTSIVVFAYAGNDTVRMTHTVTVSATLYGGDGNDSLFDNGPGRAVLYGEAGDDLLVSVGGGADQAFGGAGFDSIWMDTADSAGDVSAAETAGGAFHRIGQFLQPTSNPAQRPSLEMQGQDLVDPTSSYSYSNFSNRPLWVDGPEYNDIRQGSLGDCYFLASLASLADTDPNILRQMIAPMGDGTFVVRFYENGSPTYIRIDGDLPGSGFTTRYAKITPDGESWVALAEKAYAQFRTRENSYASLEGGWMDPVYRAVTGQATARYYAAGANMGVWMADQLAAGHALSAGTWSNPTAGPVVGLHAYQVKGVEIAADQTYVTVYNPWGFDGAMADSTPSDGLVRLRLDQFQADFSLVIVSLA
jgi:hypothetical protein